MCFQRIIWNSCFEFFEVIFKKSFEFFSEIECWWNVLKDVRKRRRVNEVFLNSNSDVKINLWKIFFAFSLGEKKVFPLGRKRSDFEWIWIPWFFCQYVFIPWPSFSLARGRRTNHDWSYSEIASIRTVKTESVARLVQSLFCSVVGSWPKKENDWETNLCIFLLSGHLRYIKETFGCVSGLSLLSNYRNFRASWRTFGRVSVRDNFFDFQCFILSDTAEMSPFDPGRDELEPLDDGRMDPGVIALLDVNISPFHERLLHDFFCS